MPASTLSVISKFRLAFLLTTTCPLFFLALDLLIPGYDKRQAQNLQQTLGNPQTLGR
jgi:hypothetical protein